MSPIKENIHLAENIKLFTDVNKQIFEKILFKLKSDCEIFPKQEFLNVDPKD